MMAAATLPKQWSPGFVKKYSEEENWWCHHQHEKSKQRTRHLLWREYLRDPLHRWDYRDSKVGLAYLDVKNKATKKPLWIDERYTPSWVAEE
eukprot:c10911_g1_i1 orf=58-333(+)